MKILFVLPSLEAGGAERVVITLANALSIRHEVSLFVMLDRGVLFSLLDPRVRLVRGLPKGNTFWRKGRILWKLYQEARQHHVVVAGLEITATYFAALAAKLANRPCVAWVHTLLSEYLTLSYFANWHRGLCQFLYKRLPYQVFVSEGAKASMLRLIGGKSKAKRLSVIYNPVIFSATVSNDLPHLPSKPFILAVGRLAPEKGFDRLIQAFASLRKTHPSTSLLILGEGEMRASLEAQIKTLGLSNVIHLPGFVENVTVYYRQASVFALTSTIEGLSMALLEAMQSEVSIVAVRLPSVDELLGETIQAVAQGDIAGLTQSLANALDHPESAHIKQMRRLKAESFTPEYAIEHWERLFDQLPRSQKK